MLRGRYEVTVNGHYITLPHELRSEIYELLECREIFLLLRPIEQGAYQVTLHSRMPKKIKSSRVLRRIDAQGRINLPVELCNMLREEGSATVKLVGLLDRFEIWIPWRLAEVDRRDEEAFPDAQAVYDATIGMLGEKGE